jgi:hypothetical protein
MSGDTVIGQVFYQNLGSFPSGTYVDHIVLTLTGPFSTTITFAPHTEFITLGPGMIFGQYSYSMQAYGDPAGTVALGPPSNGKFWYNPTPNEVLPLPQSARIVVTQ